MIIKDFLDNDLYKFTTMNAIQKKFPNTEVLYKFINRGKTVFPEGFAKELRYQPIGFELLPERFTIPELQNLYETVLEIKLDRRNFRKKILDTGLLIDHNESIKGKPHKGANLYSFDENKYQQLSHTGFNFEI